MIFQFGLFWLRKYTHFHRTTCSSFLPHTNTVLSIPTCGIGPLDSGAMGSKRIRQQKGDAARRDIARDRAVSKKVTQHGQTKQGRQQKRDAARTDRHGWVGRGGLILGPKPAKT